MSHSGLYRTAIISSKPRMNMAAMAQKGGHLLLAALLASCVACACMHHRGSSEHTPGLTALTQHCLLGLLLSDVHKPKSSPFSFHITGQMKEDYRALCEGTC